jgi:hypothetical protein
MASVERDFVFDSVLVTKSATLPSIDTQTYTKTKNKLPAGNIGLTIQSLPLLPPKKTLVFSDGEKWIPVQPQYGGSGSAPIIDMNDGTTATQNPGTNVLNIVGDNTDSAAPFTQRRSGILTTSLNANTVQIQNQRDITSYVVGDPTIYNTQFATIQEAVDQAVADGVDVSATPRREVIIMVRPGEYPDDVSIPRHGIHIVNFTSGTSKDVVISGTFAFDPVDAASKTVTNIQGIDFADSVEINANVPGSNAVIAFSRCLFENGLNASAASAAIEVTLSESILESAPFTMDGTDVYIVLQNNSSIENIVVDVTASCTIQATNSTFNVSESSLCPVLTVRARTCSLGLNLFVPGATVYASQQIELNLVNCDVSNCNAYGSFLPECIVSGCIMNTLTLGDPSPANADSFYQYCATGVALEDLRPFIISGCTFKDVVTLTMKSNIAATPQSIALYHCIFNTSINGATSALRLNDYSSAFHADSPQTFILEHCNISGCISMNLDDAGAFINVFIGANEFVRIKNSIIDLRNCVYPFPPYACIVGGSTLGLTPRRVSMYQNAVTLRDATDFVFNGLGDGIILVTGQESGGNLSGNFITTPGTSFVNIGTGVFSIIQHGTNF